MELGDTIKIKDVPAENFEILNNPRVTVATVSIPRLTRMAEEEEAAAEAAAEAEAMLEDEEGAVSAGEGEEGDAGAQEEKSE
jgi:hypothetical protein